MFVNIGVFFIAVSFGIFAVFLSKILLRISSAASILSDTARKMESSMDGTISELEKVIGNTYVTAIDMEVKLNAVDGVFHIADDVGQTAELVSAELNELTSNYEKQNEVAGFKPFVGIIHSAEFVRGLITSWKRGQKAIIK